MEFRTFYEISDNLAALPLFFTLYCFEFRNEVSWNCLFFDLRFWYSKQNHVTYLTQFKTNKRWKMGMEDWISVWKIISVFAWNCIWLPVIIRPEQYQCRYHITKRTLSNSQNSIPWGEILLSTQPTDRHQRSSSASLKFAVWWFVLSLVISAWWQTQSNWKHFSRSSCLTSWHANRTKVVLEAKRQTVDLYSKLVDEDDGGDGRRDDLVRLLQNGDHDDCSVKGNVLKSTSLNPQIAVLISQVKWWNTVIWSFKELQKSGRVWSSSSYSSRFIVVLTKKRET